MNAIAAVSLSWGIGKDNQLLFVCSNSFTGEVKTEADGSFITHKEDNRNHGLGIKNIKEAAARLGGDVTITAEDNIFTVKVIIRI